MELITFEGGEGSGKSTAAKHLAEKLKVPLFREPGGTPLSEQIRNLLVSGDTKMSPWTELLLMTAARAHLCDHWRTLKLPLVICDRFFDSTLAYQFFAGKMSTPIDEIILLQMRATKALVPTKTFWIDVDPEVGLARTAKRGTPGEARFENKGLSYHQSVRQGYQELHKLFPERIIRIDSTHLDENGVIQEILRYIPNSWMPA